MRLIDADALTKVILDEGIKGNGFSDREREREVFSMIDNMPTMEYGRKAYWVEYDGLDKGFHFCSNCKTAAFNYYDDETIEVLSFYCPNCGYCMV